MKINPWQSDNGDGTYTNPPLYGDFPDPDIIRVGDDFYFATTTFANTPGLTILHSRDLVSWEYAAHVIPRLDGREQYDLKNGNSYRAGVFAPSLRYHQETLYIAVTPVRQNTRIYYAKTVHGPWRHHELDRPAFDPALFFDDDGKAYLATSGGWDGTVTLLSLNDDCSKVTEERKIHFNKGAEGSKIIKRSDWYYLFNAIPFRLGMTVSRAKSLFGPWETRNQIDDTTGGHQGALVDLPDGTWYGFVMCDCGAIGRMTNISPIFWENDWPVWGTPDAPGRVPAVAQKPIKRQRPVVLATSDEFDSPELGLQWQWNHNPEDVRWSLTERPGFLRLLPTIGDDIWTARNTLTQKAIGPWCRGEIRLDVSRLAAGDICGFGTFGKFCGSISVHRSNDTALFLSMEVVEDTGEARRRETRVKSEPVAVTEIFLRTEMDFRTDHGLCSYSLDGKAWKALGGEFPIAYDWRTGTFQGQQFAIYCFNPNPGNGCVDVDYFHMTGRPKAEELQSVSFHRLEYAGQELGAPAKLNKGEYRNPILAGFYPDPSVCRVGKDYYLINSTFEYFPGLPIFHSRDLINWKQIGNAIHRPEQLTYRSSHVSAGLFAPAISHHKGTFYVVCTMIDGPGNFVVTARNPAGPWSNPVPLSFEGIDPALFFDDDGRAWMVNNGGPDEKPRYDGHRAIWIQEFDPVEMKMVGRRKQLVNGGIDISKKPIWIEGPHIFKRNGFYYLCCAEGGTAAEHSQVILRSKSVRGPYKPWTGNPILTQRDVPGNGVGAVTCTGHADMTIGPDGNWWAVFLAVRPYEKGFSTMGRETFLLPVTWTEDGWPRILPRGERVPLAVKAPKGAVVSRKAGSPLNGSYAWRENFKTSKLSLHWLMLRHPRENWWKLHRSAGRLELAPRADRLTGSGNPSFLARRVGHPVFVAAVAMDVPHDDAVSGGLVFFLNEKHHYYMAAKKNGKGVRLYLERVKAGWVEEIATASLRSAHSLELRVSADRGTCQFQYRMAGGAWKILCRDADATMITFNVPDGLFLGATVGPHARIDS